MKADSAPNNSSKKSNKAIPQKDKTSFENGSSNPINTKSKKTLTLNTEGNTQKGSKTANLNKVNSPKNVSALASPKSMIKVEGDSKEVTKKQPTTHTKKLSELSKFEPPKKQQLSTLRSPKNKTLAPKLPSNSQQDIRSAKNNVKSNFKKSKMNEESSLILQSSTLTVEDSPSSVSKIDSDFILQDESSIFSESRKETSERQDLEKINEKDEEIKRLTEQNDLLVKKMKKIKDSQTESRRLLKEKISSFNEEGEEKMLLKQRIEQLQVQRETILKEKQELKLLSTQDSTTKSTQMQDRISKDTEVKYIQNKNIQAFQTDGKTNQETKVSIGCNTEPIEQKIVSTEHQIAAEKGRKTSEEQPEVSSRTDSSVCDVSAFNSSDYSIIDPTTSALTLESVKTRFEEKYSQKLKQLEDFLRQSYLQLQIRYQSLEQESKTVLKEQSEQILILQRENDKLHQRLEEENIQSVERPSSTMASNKSIHFVNTQTDQSELRFIKQINDLKQEITSRQKKQLQLVEELHMKELECKRLRAQLDSQRLIFSKQNKLLAMSGQIVEISKEEELSLVKEQLRVQKENCQKLAGVNAKKDELIKKMSLSHQQSSTSKKYQGKK